MGQKFLMLPQTITVDLSTKTKYHIDNIDKEIRKGKEKPSIIGQVIFKMCVLCRKEKKKFHY